MSMIADIVKNIGGEGEDGPRIYIPLKAGDPLLAKKVGDQITVTLTGNLCHKEERDAEDAPDDKYPNGIEIELDSKDQEDEETKDMPKSKSEEDSENDEEIDKGLDEAEEK